MAFLLKLPGYAPVLFWITILLAFVTAFFVINGMRVNRGEVISPDPILFALGSLAALGCAAAGILLDPLILLWIAIVAGALGTWGAAVDVNRRAPPVDKKKPRSKSRGG